MSTLLLMIHAIRGDHRLLYHPCIIFLSNLATDNAPKAVAMRTIFLLTAEGLSTYSSRIQMGMQAGYGRDSARDIHRPGGEPKVKPRGGGNSQAKGP
ncbi:MAG: hypothetical protein DRG87_06550 [Deltaproteobacteria bacterium]|nr:MAG: hypothetical protein DRG87_06550 [Deltaproteobacteria bacterium]